ncbi:hypothetical protein TWF569_011384 [Orbilia oligospora]|uniref:Uncharacterized protein n=1 Tax=Orbilia oligospora TaxID=2813651 RepID=A0A7C8JQB2_ORBOL|nr:hypothetical protein TWF703_004150 [Orbilia oligospora]KAF3154731.1 hypothetical protein TWF569_011384 [Orbilia oligospora]
MSKEYGRHDLRVAATTAQKMRLTVTWDEAIVVFREQKQQKQQQQQQPASNVSRGQPEFPVQLKHPEAEGKTRQPNQNGTDQNRQAPAGSS